MTARRAFPLSNRGESAQDLTESTQALRAWNVVRSADVSPSVRAMLYTLSTVGDPGLSVNSRRTYRRLLLSLGLSDWAVAARPTGRPKAEWRVEADRAGGVRRAPETVQESA